MRGYKLATIRGIVDDGGIIEDIRLGPANIHDFRFCEEMLLTSPVLKQNDILINDRGFLSRPMINALKTDRDVDVYVPLKENMEAYQLAVSVAVEKNQWAKHPNRKRDNQMIALVTDIGPYWNSENLLNDVPINACVVWDKESDKYFVFVTTDLTKSAKQIVQMYELRPEIEEDYRQLKDFWKLEDFKSTKFNTIAFHIVCVLLGYLFFQLFRLLPEGEQWLGRSLPVVLKNYTPTTNNHIIVYAKNVFGVFPLIELLEIYSSCSVEAKQKLLSIEGFA